MFSKKYIIVLFSLISIHTFAQSDEQAITTVVNNYLEGGTNGEVDRFKSAFFPDAVQRSIGKTGVTGMTVEALASKIKAGTKMERSTKIVSWSIAGTAATAITETEYPTSKIIDMLNLLKLNGEWKIVSRVYSRLEKEESLQSSNPPALAKAETGQSKGKTNAASTPAAKPAPKKKPASDDGW
jgi:Putative lumazine-binding